MIRNLEPKEIILREPTSYVADLPIWGKQIIDFITPRYLLDADQIVSSLYGRGNRTGKKKLYQLSSWDFLKRYEIYCIGEKTPIIAYTLGTRGMRLTGKLAPVVSLEKAQEYIIANDYIFSNQHRVGKNKLYQDSTLLIGEVYIDKYRLGLWCPRNEEENRIKSLAFELTPYKGLITIAPNKKCMSSYHEQIKSLNINKPIYFTNDLELEKLWYSEDEILKELDDY